MLGHASRISLLQVHLVFSEEDVVFRRRVASDHRMRVRASRKARRQTISYTPYPPPPSPYRKVTPLPLPSLKTSLLASNSRSNRPLGKRTSLSASSCNSNRHHDSVEVKPCCKKLGSRRPQGAESAASPCPHPHLSLSRAEIDEMAMELLAPMLPPSPNLPSLSGRETMTSVSTPPAASQPLDDTLVEDSLSNIYSEADIGGKGDIDGNLDVTLVSEIIPPKPSAKAKTSLIKVKQLSFASFNEHRMHSVKNKSRNDGQNEATRNIRAWCII